MLIERTKKLPGFLEAINQGDSDGKTPLHWAMWKHPKPDVVQTLIDAGANVNASSKSLYTPLHLAAKHGHVSSGTILIQAGADRFAVSDNGNLPLDLTMRWDQDEMSLASHRSLQPTYNHTVRKGQRQKSLL